MAAPCKPMAKPPAPKREPKAKALPPKRVPQRDGLAKFAKSIRAI